MASPRARLAPSHSTRTSSSMTAADDEQVGGRPVRNNSSSLRRALSILAFIGDADDHPGGLTLGELATGVSLSKSTLLRLLAPLCESALLEQDTQSGRYRLGPANAYLGQIYLERLDLPNLARDALRRMMQESGETAHLVVIDGIEVLYLDKVEARQPVRMYSRIGTRQPAYCTGVGKALLAYAEPDVVDAVIAAGMPRRTPRTITTEPALIRELGSIRERGYAIDNIENEEDIRCVAAPIFDHRSVAIAALSISGPANRVTPERITDLGRLARRAAAEISQRLGAPIGEERRRPETPGRST